jgi:protein SCO1/2
VKLGDYFKGQKQPVILQLGYYGCPMLCDLISQGATQSLKELSLNAGADYHVVFISIDPKEDWTLAQKKKRSYVTEYGRPGAAGGWHFLTGRQDDIKRVCQAVGFNYKWVPSAGQFSHPAGLIICTPEGKISRYLYGVRFEEKTLRLSLVEASEGKIGTTTDHFLLTCFQYDGKQGKYALAAMGLMRIGGAVTVVVLFCVLVWLFRREARRKA